MAHSIGGFLEQFRKHPVNREIYLRNGNPPAVGDVIVLRELGATLRAMAEAEQRARGTREQGIDAVRDYFYRGPIAKAMVDFSRRTAHSSAWKTSSHSPFGRSPRKGFLPEA